MQVGHCGVGGNRKQKGHTYISTSHTSTYIGTSFTHKHSDTVHTDSSLESTTTTSTTLLLVNLEASFTGVTWLRRCHSPTNQYHSESSGSTLGVCGWVQMCACLCVCVWLAESGSSCGWTLPFWPVYWTVITWEETSIQLLLTSSTNEVKHRQTGKDSKTGRTDRQMHWLKKLQW